MGVLRLVARAKINLHLGVGETLDSGYHQVTTIIQSITLADEVHIEPSDELICLCDDRELNGPNNLAHRAAAVLRERFNVRQGAQISLRKRIPIGAGLGGGSADAAAVLVGLDRFWELGADNNQLLDLAAGIGADVPFCLHGGTALATGFGEQITPLPALDLGQFLVIKPDQSLSTALVYEEYDSLYRRSKIGVEAMVAAIDAGDRNRVIKLLANSLEPAAENLLPAVRDLKEAALSAGAEAAMVSGSGSAVMVFPPENMSPQRLAQKLSNQPGDVFIVECAPKGVGDARGH